MTEQVSGNDSPTHHSYYADRCKSCHQATDRDFLNALGECPDCAVQAFCDYLERHPHAKRAEIVAEGRRVGLGDAQINLVVAIQKMNAGTI